MTAAGDAAACAGRDRLQPRRRRGLRRPGGPVLVEGLRAARASRSTARWSCPTASRWRRRCAAAVAAGVRRGRHHRRHRPDADRPHPGGDPRGCSTARSRASPRPSGRTGVANGCRPRRCRAGWPGWPGAPWSSTCPGSTGGVRDGLAVLGPVLGARRRPDRAEATTRRRAGLSAAPGRSSCATATSGCGPMRLRDGRTWRAAARRNARLAAPLGRRPRPRAGAPTSPPTLPAAWSGTLTAEARGRPDAAVRRSTYRRRAASASSRSAASPGGRCARRTSATGSTSAVAGRGIMPTAVALAVRPLLRHRRAAPDRGQHPARRTPRRCGWWRSWASARRGCAPRYLHIDGDWRDHLAFALTREEVPDGLLARYHRYRRDTPPRPTEHRPVGT